MERPQLVYLWSLSLCIWVRCWKALWVFVSHIHNYIFYLCRVLDIIFSKCSEKVVVYLRNRSRLTIHGSTWAQNNVLLFCCLVMYRTLRKSNVLHKSQMENIVVYMTIEICYRAFHHLKIHIKSIRHGRISVMKNQLEKKTE